MSAMVKLASLLASPAATSIHDALSFCPLVFSHDEELDHEE
jgi:hypothetical protein